jgi:hypothetical protein
MQGIDAIVSFFLSPTLVLCKNALIVSTSPIIAETDNFNEGELPLSGMKLQRR